MERRIWLRMDVRWVIRENGGFVWFPEDGRIEVLNSTAAIIVASFLDGLSVDAVVARLAEKFPEVPRATLEVDVQCFLQALETKGLLAFRRSNVVS